MLRFLQKRGLVTRVEAGNDSFEVYLAETTDLRKESALVCVDGGWQTLDGTPHISLSEMAQQAGCSLESLQAAFDAGEIEGVLVGNKRFARQEKQKIEREA